MGGATCAHALSRIDESRCSLCFTMIRLAEKPPPTPSLFPAAADHRSPSASEVGRAPTSLTFPPPVLKKHSWALKVDALAPLPHVRGSGGVTANWDPNGWTPLLPRFLSHTLLLCPSLRRPRCGGVFIYARRD